MLISLKESKFASDLIKLLEKKPMTFKIAMTLFLAKTLGITSIKVIQEP